MDYRVNLKVIFQYYRYNNVASINMDSYRTVMRTIRMVSYNCTVKKHINKCIDNDNHSELFI